VRIRLRALEAAPDAVVLPADAEQVQAVLGACAEHGVAVVPFGGGTSVVGGVDALRGAHHAAIALDLRRLEGLDHLDSRSQLATLRAGTTGPAAEQALAARGMTLGHLPQSFEFSTVGGWVATRSAGQASTGYGRIDGLVRSLRAATPAGPIDTLTVPATAAGPDLRELLVGSEGTLGVITEATLRVRPRPAVTHDEGWALPGFSAASEAFRALAQAGAPPTIARLSDEEETRFTLAMAGSAAGALRAYLRARGQQRPCLAILGFEGAEDDVRDRRRRAARILREHGAVALGARPGAAWRAGRFHGPYLRDTLMTDGFLVDTLETATTWTNLLETYRAVGAALRTVLAGGGTPALVGCHVSHLYPTGASLYFTFLARAQRGAELEQWAGAKRAAGDAIAAAGATITHHHAVGRDHAPWLAHETGELGLALLRGAKATLDPAGIMNPGKLVA
jgi:alkyldihydroxyacetonephosphate synthase